MNLQWNLFYFYFVFYNKKFAFILFQFHLSNANFDICLAPINFAILNLYLQNRFCILPSQLILKFWIFYHQSGGFRHIGVGGSQGRRQHFLSYTKYKAKICEQNLHILYEDVYKGGRAYRGDFFCPQQISRYAPVCMFVNLITPNTLGKPQKKIIFLVAGPLRGGGGG